MNTRLAQAVALALTGSALSLGAVSNASATSTTMYNLYRANFAGYDSNGLAIYSSTSTTPCAPCANSSNAVPGVANDAGGWTDGWVWSENPQVEQIDPPPNPLSPITPIGESKTSASANRPGWVGIGGSSTPTKTTPFGYSGSTTLHWAVEFTGGAGGTAEISNADAIKHYKMSADIDTARGAWSDAALTGAAGWRHDLDFGLFKSDLGGQVTLSVSGVSGDGTTKSFGFTIFKGMDTSTGVYNHHGAWNAGNNAQTGAPTSASLPGGGFNLGTANVVAYSVGGATPQNLNTISFTAEAGQIYTIALGGYKNGGWTDTTDGYKLAITQSPPAPSKYTLSVNTTGAGTGKVTGTPGSIDCGSVCSWDYDSGTSVTLTATPDSGFQLSGWSGACIGTGSCIVTMDAAKSVTAGFAAAPPPQYALTVSKSGNGSITSSPSGINCGSDCSENYNSGTSVTLTATPDSGYSFSGWSGACTGTGSCVVSMTSAKNVSASFAVIPPPQYALTVSKTGNGTVTSSPAGINCGADCSENYNSGTSVSLTATPDSGHQFSGWSGACTGTGSCSVTMDQAKTVTATFAVIPPPDQYALTVTKVGSGSVVGNVGGLNCGSTCSVAYDSGTPVVLTATADSGYTFTSWNGACSGTGPCSVTMDAAKNVTATFTPIPPSQYALTVTNGGNGTVTSSPAGIDCGTDCSSQFNSGQLVTLTALPANGYVFSGWSGACSGTDICTVTMDAAKNVTAGFALNPVSYLLTVNTSGNGSVASSPSGIDCGTDCSENYAGDAVVTLTAAPATGYEFKGWSGGGCSGTGTCIVTMDAEKEVTALFQASQSTQYALTVSKIGNGSITSSPSGINCGSDCSENYNSGTPVTLTASPDTGFVFSGWSGAGCSGTEPCIVTMDAARDVIATFDLAPPSQYALTVTANGNGTVTSDPAGIDCGPTCVAAFDRDSSVTLTATPETGYQFSGWSGACTNASGDCTVEMNDLKAVAATFTPIPPPSEHTLIVTNGGHGTVASSPAGISCGATCDASFSDGDTVALTATPDSGYQFGGWSGDCSNLTGPCEVTMSTAKNVTATFTLIPPPSEYTLTVTNGGHGTVSSSPSGINCGATCSASFSNGQRVTLSAKPENGYQFSGWSGDCTNASGGCSVTMNGIKKVSATFTRIPPPSQYTLTVTNGGHGTVSSSPSGISCGASCNASFIEGRTVTLTATPDSGYQFSGWSGACSNASGDCSVGMNAAQNVTATFTALPPPNEYTLTISNGGHGTVASAPAGIDCGITCSTSFTSGQTVTLTATPDSGWRFSGWNGACSGTEACTVELTESKTVTAQFVLPPQRDFNGDGYSDLFWRDRRTGFDELWLMTDGKIAANKTVPRKGRAWLLAATADFNGDQQADILWRHRSTGQNHIWLMKGSRIKSEVVLPDQVTAFDETRTGDFDGDGQTDILWHNPTTSEARLWLMQGTVFKSAVPLPTAPPGYALSAVGDFNGDGAPDIWWYQASTGRNMLWLMAGTSVQSTEIPPAQTSEWIFAGTGRFDDDNRADVLWRNRRTRETQLWLMDGATRTSIVDLPPLTRTWFAAGIDDFDGDGGADILWRNRKNGKNRLWIMDDTAIGSKHPVDAIERKWSTPSH